MHQTKTHNRLWKAHLGEKIYDSLFRLIWTLRHNENVKLWIKFLDPFKTCHNHEFPRVIHGWYSGISIYRSRNVRFLVFIVRHLWSQIKFHINNVIYFCIHRSPNLSFIRLYRCKSRSRHSICHMDFLAWFVWEKKLKWAIYVGSVLRTSATRGRLYVCTVYPYLFVLYHLRFPRDLQFRVIHICVFSMIMALRKKCVRTLHDRFKIIHEVEKKVCHLYWKVINHAMYTKQTRRSDS
jgi:hypothetical protein